MKLAIMQPYFLPYLGYFQLVAAVEKFVFLDDVGFILQGWINRNRILCNGAELRFTIPVSGASPNTLIRDVRIAANSNWKRKLLNTVQHSYRKAPFYDDVFKLFYSLIQPAEGPIGELAKTSVLAVYEYLKMDVAWVKSSSVYENVNLKGTARILDICRRENATVYVNLPGGRELYDSDSFRAVGIDLRFVEPALAQYVQGNATFVSGLSILDVLMFNSIEQVRHLVKSATLSPVTHHKNLPT